MLKLVNLISQEEEVRKISVSRQFVTDSNATLIADFLRQEYPEANEGREEPVLEGVMSEMIGSRQVRLAGVPSPESLVAMRDVVRSCIRSGHPIPCLVVSGPKKTKVNEGVDLAELSAMKMLACLNKRVMKHFSPGIVVRVRLEDTTGLYLEEGVEGLTESMERYINGFTVLASVLGYEFIIPVREHTLMTIEQLRQAADKIFPLLMAYLKDSQAIEEEQWPSLESWQKLQATGWQGLIPREMREYYHARYSHLFPEFGADERLVVTAKYLAGTLARYQLKALGNDPSLPGFFQINFAPPVPGIPKSLVSTRLYYRTVPLNQTKRHIPFWRAKGVLKLNGKARISLLSWNEPFDCFPFAVSFSNGTDSVSVQSDYVLG